MNTYLRCALLFAVLACVTAHAAKKIYACKDAAGNAIFSPDTCGKDAKELHNVDAGSSAAANASAAADSVGSEPGAKKPSAIQPPSGALREISDSVADSTCRRDAQNALVYPSDINLLDLERDKANLAEQTRNANLPGAVREQDLREQIGTMEVAIRQERFRLAEARDRADAVHREAIADCDRHKTDRERARSAESAYR